MNRDDFLKIEYSSLRDEIKETKSRIFKIMGIGLIGVPAINFLAHAYEIDVLTLSLPIIVLIIGLLYLSENHALMRCGRYIREHIEINIENIEGWEHWLITPDIFRKRAVDRYLFFSFYLLYLVYFAGSSYVSFLFSLKQYGVIWAGTISGLYVAIGFWSAVFIFRNKLISTTTVTESVA